jgi:parvulin-like peptidyl-prolyl isomerase
MDSEGNRGHLPEGEEERPPAVSEPSLEDLAPEKEAAGETAAPAGETGPESTLPAWVRARRTAGVAAPRRGWNPLVVIGALLVVVVAALFAADRLQSVSGSSSASSSRSTSTSSSTPPPLPTPTPPATPVIKGGSVAAIVNGHSIPTSRYQTLLNFAVRQSAGQAAVKTLARDALNQIIQDQLVSDYAGAHHIRLSASELNARIQQFRTHYGGEKGFQRWLASVDLNSDSFKTLLTASLLEQKVAQQVAPVAAAHVRHILVLVHPPGQKAVRTDAAGRAKAQQLLTQIQHGANFAMLAKKNSDDPGSKLKGGDLGTIYPHATVPQFDHAAFTLPLNHPALVRSQFGYHIIEVLSRVKNAPLPIDPTGQQAYQQSQQPVLTAWLNTQMKKASIKRIATVQG